MIIERTKEKKLVRLSPLTNTTVLQDLSDYLEYKELASKSKAKQRNIDELANQVNRSLVENYKVHKGLTLEIPKLKCQWFNRLCLKRVLQIHPPQLLSTGANQLLPSSSPSPPSPFPPGFFRRA